MVEELIPLRTNMARIKLLFALLIGFVPSLYCQFPVPADTLYKFIKYNSVLRNSVNWSQVDVSFKGCLEEAKSLHDTMICFVEVLENLNDVHSQIYLNGKYYGHFPSFDDTTLAWLVPLNEKANQQTNRIQIEVLQDTIGYLRVPGFQVYEPTANGYTTSNGYFQFAPNLMLNFATNFVADRNRNVYRTTVEPDSFVYHGDDFNALLQDKKVVSALDWLRRNSGGR